MSPEFAILFLYGLPFALAYAVLQYVFWLIHERQAAHLYWGTANLAAIAGALLLLFRGSIPWWTTALLANSLVCLSSLLTWAGLRHFQGKRPSVREFGTYLLLFAIAYQSLVMYRNELGLRIVLVSLVFFLTNAAMALEMWRAQYRQYLAMRVVLIVTMAAHALYYLYRSAWAAMLDADSDLLHTAGYLDEVVTVGMTKSTIWNLAAVLMVREAWRARRAPALGGTPPGRAREPAR
jgi:hypothetical protein